MVMAPLEPEELLARCDLAGVAKVIAVTNDRCGHCAHLRFTTIAKGTIKRSVNGRRGVAVVRLRGSARGPNGEVVLGGWTDWYEQNSTVFTHLEWDKEIGFYCTLWWNAVRDPRPEDFVPSGLQGWLKKHLRRS